MKRFELTFLDGPGAGRLIEADEIPKVVWLCNANGMRWWRLREPELTSQIEARYNILGYSPLGEERYRIAYKHESQGPRRRLP